LQQIGRSLILFLGVLYTAGLLIVNIDLARYGTTSLDLARPEYVLAGALWALMLVPSIAAILMSSFMVSVIRKRYWLAAVLAAVSTVLSGVFVPGMLLGAASGFGSALSLGEKLKRAGDMSALSLVNTAILIGGWLVASIFLAWFRRSPPTPTFRMVYAALTVPFLVAVVLPTLTLYAVVAFPLIPKHFGGGKRSVVTIGLSERRPELLRRLGLPISQDGLWVGPVSLVQETAGALLVTASMGNNESSWRFIRHPAVAIDKKLAMIVSFDPRARHEAVPDCEGRPSPAAARITP
jgi:hypothetical protein